jgi:hypothetical protein
LKKPVALLLGLAALGVAGAETAAAQGLYYYGPGGFYGQRYYMPGMAPWRIARIVRSAGMTPLSSPARRGPVYEVVAIDPEGRHVRVAVDAYRGSIMSVRPVAVLRPNGEPYGSRVAVAPPAPPPEQDDMVPGSRLGPTPSQPGAGRIPPQALPPYAGQSQANASTAPQINAPHAVQPPQAAQPAPNPRIANAPAFTGATPPVENQRTPIPRPRPNAAATAAVTPAPSAVPSPARSPTPAAAPSAAATAPAEVPEGPPAPIRARPSPPAAAATSAAAAAASAKAAPPAAAANASAATGSTTTGSMSATAKTEPRPPTTLVPVAPLE